jgi:hypothetical protein
MEQSAVDFTVQPSMAQADSTVVADADKSEFAW